MDPLWGAEVGLMGPLMEAPHPELEIHSPPNIHSPQILTYSSAWLLTRATCMHLNSLLFLFHNEKLMHLYLYRHLPSHAHTLSGGFKPCRAVCSKRRPGNAQIKSLNNGTRHYHPSHLNRQLCSVICTTGVTEEGDR
jgi:hypothetical protein